MKKHLKDRIDKAATFKQAFPVSFLSLGEFYQGVELISKKRYFDWLYQKTKQHAVVQHFENQNQIPTVELIIMVLFDLAEENDGFEDADFILLEQLLIEPFYEMVEGTKNLKKTGEKSNEQTHDCKRNL